MSNIPATTLAQIKRFGQTCTVSFKAVGSGSNARSSESLATVIKVGSKTTTVVGGQLTAANNAMMPPTDRSVMGAKITVGARTYTVQSATEMLYEGTVYFQKLVLT